MFGQHVENKVDVKQRTFGSVQKDLYKSSPDLSSRDFDWRDYEWWIAGGVGLVIIFIFAWWMMSPGKAVEKEPSPAEFETQRTFDNESSSRDQVKAVPHNRILSDGFH